MERNEALLRKVGDVIANEPERYDQDVWLREDACGTVGCIAGHAATFAENYAGCGGMGTVVVGEGRLAWVEMFAQEVLGLTPDEAEDLFSPGWQPAGDLSAPLHLRVREALYRLADGAPIDEVSA